MTWQYNGSAPWESIIQWCYKNLQGEWRAEMETIHFKQQSDYAWFSLRWR